MGDPVSREDDGREIPERVSRCVATMVYYHKDGYSWSGANLLIDEARTFLAWAAGLGLGDSVRDRVLTPVERELSDRYGPEVGHRLHGHFLRALEDAAEARRELETPHLKPGLAS